MKQKQGYVIAVKSGIVEIQFEDTPPAIGEVVELTSGTQLVVDSMREGGVVVCLNIRNDLAVELNMNATATGHGIQIPVGTEMIGRIVDAFGSPLDGGPAPKTSKTKDIFAHSKHSVVRTNAKPELLETGIKVVDFFAPFVKGKKVGIIGGAGVGKTVLMMELMHNVAKKSSNMSFFTGIGERVREGHELYETLQERGLLDNTCMLFGQMNEVPVQRSLVGVASTALAEYFRDEHKKDILFFVDNMYRYIQARNELASELGQIPSEGGYQPTIFSDIKLLQDRLSSNQNGSITAIETIYVPADDLSDPAVQMIQRDLDSTLVLSRKVAEQGIRPAVDLLQTTSALISPEFVGTRHYELNLKVKAILQKYESLKAMISIIGESELSVRDAKDYKKAQAITEFFSQRASVTEDLNGKKGEYYTIEQTLDGIEAIVHE